MMGPDEVAEHLRALANYINQEESPRRDLVKNGVSGVLTSISPKVATDMTKFLGRDYEVVVKGLEQLISKLSKALKTLNPQDEARNTLNASLVHFRGLQESLRKSFEELDNIEI